MSAHGEPAAARTLFERRIVPLTLRLDTVERDEERLEERVQNARADSVVVVRSTARLVSQFPDILVPDPLDGRWTMRPLDPSLGEQWQDRRRRIVETEVPALNTAAEAAAAAAKETEAETAMLPRRAEAARHATVTRRGPDAIVRVAEDARGWRRVLRRLFRRRPPMSLGSLDTTIETTIGLQNIAGQMVELAQAGAAVEQQQAEFGKCVDQVRRIANRLEELEQG